MRLLTCVSLFATIGTIAQSSAPQSEEATPQRLQLTVRTSKNVYRLGGTMHLETQLTNIADDTVYVWRWNLCWGQGPALNMQVLDSSGHDVHTDILLDCVPPPPKLEDMSEFIRVDPGNFYGRSDDFKLRELVNKPGEYTLIIRCGSWPSPTFLAEAGFPKLPYWNANGKPLVAKVDIVVKP